MLCDAPSGFDEAAAAALGAARAPIVTFEAQRQHGVGAAHIARALAERKVAASVSSPAHTFDEALRQRPPTVRLSPHYFNTEAEVDAVVHHVREVVLASSQAGGVRRPPPEEEREEVARAAAM